MTLLALKNFGSNIVRGTANSTFALPIEFEFGSKTEITYLYLHSVVQEQVTKLEISMDDSVTVQVLDSAAYLIQIALYLDLVESLTSPQQLVERLVLAELKQNVNVLSVFEEMLEADNMVVMEGTVNLDLTHQLLLGARLCK